MADPFEIVLWEFMDKDGSYVEFGNFSSANQISTISSERIEARHQVHQIHVNHHVDFQVYPSGLIYHLDFNQMIQKNDISGVERPIRRVVASGVRQLNWPVYWQSMRNVAELLVVPLSIRDNPVERKSVLDRFRDQNPGFVPLLVARVQKPNYWQDYLKGKDTVAAKRNNPIWRLEEQLWHGTAVTSAINIIKKSFDLNFCGASSGSMEGKGINFSNSAALSCEYSKGEIKAILLNSVVVGSILKGRENMIEPPLIPGTEIRADTTVDNINNPTIFVKYAKESFVTRYLIIFTHGDKSDHIAQQARALESAKCLIL